MALLIILGLAGAIGAIIQTIGAVKQTEAQAAQDRANAEEANAQAGQLETLSASGGYYDQQLAAIASDLADVEGDRIAAGQMAGYQAISTSRQGEAATGQIAARAGTGNLAGGSVQKQKESVQTQVVQQFAQIKLQYEDQMRGLATRQASDVAQQTLTQFNKEKGTSDAAFLRTDAANLNAEADWLSTWGVGLTIAGGALNTVTAGLRPFINAGVNPFAPRDAAPAASTSSDYESLYSYGPVTPPGAYAPIGSFGTERPY
jgi:hypothetical protein